MATHPSITYPHSHHRSVPSSLPVAAPRTSPESVSGWRKQQRAEHDAGLAGPASLKILLPLFYCDLCEICIGPDYYEQELFYYPIQNESVYLGCTRTYFADFTILTICGGCARNSRRHLPALYQMVKPEYWLTTELLFPTQTATDITYADPCNAEQTAHIRTQIDQQVAACARFHLFLYCIEHTIPLSWVFLAYQQQQKQQGREREMPSYLTLMPRQQSHQDTSGIKERKREARSSRKKKRPPVALPIPLLLGQQAGPHEYKHEHEQQESLITRLQKKSAIRLFG